MQIALSESIILETAFLFEKLDYNGKLTLSQFQVVDFCISGLTTKSLIIIEVRLQRLFSYHLTNTFMPTLSLLALSELTLFFDDSNANLAMGFSLTILLVVYTMYQSISTSSPKTEYLKVIDIWIIFCLIIPLAIFMIEVVWKFRDSKTSRVDKKGRKIGFCPCGSSFLSKKRLPKLIIAATILFIVGYLIMVLCSILKYEKPCGTEYLHLH